MRNTANNAAVITLAGRLYGSLWQMTKGYGDSARKVWGADPKGEYYETALRVARDAHGDMMPDDCKWQYVADALALISEQQESADLEDIGREIEPDVYNHDLLTWAASNLSRMGYVDEAVEEYGWPGSLAQALMLGQKAEREEVYFSVLESLREIVQDEADAAEDETEEEDES